MFDALERRVLLAAAQSDDFHAPAINSTRWTFVNPLGDGSVTANGTNALISVPAGQGHDVWTGGNFAPRLMQPVSNENFELEVKFESRPDQQYEMQGLLAEASAGNYVRFDFLSDGGSLRVFGASVANNVATARIGQPIASAPVLYMRVRRAGDQWTQSYSYNGSDWNVAGTFTHALPVSQVGVFAGNAHGASSPAFTASVDYFYNTASPIVPDDGQWPADATAPRIQNVQSHNASNHVQVTWQTDDVTTGVVEYGLSDQYELGSVAQPTAGTSHSVTLSLDPLKNYHFRIRATNTNDLQAATRDYMVRSGGPVQAAPVIDVWHGANQSFGGLGQPQRWVNVIGRVTDPDGIASLTYSLNGGSPVTINPGPNTTRLENLGDFNIELPTGALVNGANSVLITARDNAQQVSTRLVTVNFTRGNVWPRNYTTDWAGATSIGQVAQVVDGLWTLSGDGVRTVEMGYDRLIAVGDVSWQDYEVTVPFTLHATTPSFPYGPPGIGILTRWSGHYGDPGRPITNDHWWPIGGLGWFHGDRLEIIGNGAATIATDGQPRPIQFGTRYVMKMRVQSMPGETSFYALKMWQDGTAEPAAWSITGSGVSGELTNGSILLLAHQADATFGRATITEITGATPPAVRGVEAQPRPTAADVTWQTDEPATAVVEYGLTTQYELGSVAQPTRGTSHAVALSGLQPQKTYHYRIRTTDASGNTSTSGDFTFTTPATPPPVFHSDDFSAGIDPGRWTFVNPRGDGAASTDGTRARISVAGGQDHDVWAGANNAARLMQAAQDQDFELEVKFESQPTQRFQLQGVVVEASPGNYLRFDFYHDGSVLRVFAASFANHSPAVRHSQVINPAAAGGALYMRVRRVGNQWTQSYSYNGTTWQTAASFSHALAVAQVGVFAGNAGGGAAPAYTAVVDYFFNTAIPVHPEDDVPPDTTPPLVQNVQTQPRATRAQVTWQTNEPATAVVEYGVTNQYELGSVAQPTLGTSHAVTLLNLQPSTTYHFRIRATDAAGNVTTSGDFTVTTPANDPPAFASDDFSDGIAPGRWTFVNPRGDGAATTDGTRALISVAAGQDHDVWAGANNAARLMQASANQDFELEVKFESQPTKQFQLQGLLVEASPGNYLRFDFYHDGGTLRIFAASFVNNAPTVRHTQAIAPASGGGSGALYMRVRRVGNQWTQSYSYDGTTWQSAASFSHALAVGQVGVFAGNAGGGAAPAYTAVVDYFFNTASPISPEDDVPPDTTPPLVQNVQSQPRATQAQVTWQTNEGATAVVEYGLSDQYELGSVAQPTLGTSHAVTLLNLQPGTTYHYRVRATDAAGNVTTSGDFTVTTTAAEPPAFESDDFSGGINPARWTFVNPRGDGAATTDGTRALISVAAGQDHDVWHGANNAARLMQASANQDFELEVKFESQPAKAYQLQGLIVEASPGNYLRFDFYHDGSTPRIFAASFGNNVPTVRHTQAINAAASGGALYMRVRRVGNQWTQSYSYDGATWLTATGFSHALAVSQVGVFAGNAGGGAAPAYTAVVDYFFNTASPISPEDDVPPDTTPPLVQDVQTQPGMTQAQVTWQTNEPATAVVEYGLTGAYELGSVAQPTPGTSHAVALPGLQPGATYHFRIRAADAAGNTTVSDGSTFVTAPDGGVSITEAAYEGRAHFVVATPSATYYFDKAGGGLSRLIDPDGNDWIAFHKDPLSSFPDSAAAGYRGIPNLVFGSADSGAGHPGFDRTQTVQLDGRTLRTTSHSGSWQWTWRFNEHHATLTVDKVDPNQPYWFLYEGPVAGRFAPADQYWGTDATGRRTDTPDYLNGGAVNGTWRWAYFGDSSVDRVLFAAQVEDDQAADMFGYMGATAAGISAPDGMALFGFGRGPDNTPLLTEAGLRFVIGFIEQRVTDQADHAIVGAAVETIIEGVAVTSFDGTQPVDTAAAAGGSVDATAGAARLLAVQSSDGGETAADSSSSSSSSSEFAYVSGTTLHVRFDRIADAPQPITLEGGDGAYVAAIYDGAVLPFTGVTGINVVGTVAADQLRLAGTAALPLTFHGVGGDDAVEVVAGGAWTLQNDLGGTARNVAVTVAAGASAVFNAGQGLRGLTVAGEATLAPGGDRLIVTGALDVTGKLDLTDNGLLLDYSGANPLGTFDGSSYGGVSGLVASAANGGAWDGNGLTSSVAAGQPGLTTLGVAAAGAVIDFAGAATATYRGEAIDATTVIVKHTYAGDANLDGAITGDDYNAIDLGVLFEGMDGYFNGDFNFDGVVTGDDYSIIDLNILLQAPADTTPPALDDVQARPGMTQARVTWQTDEPATAVVEYGLTDEYEIGSVPQPTPGTGHAVTLLDLQPSTTYHFRIRATDAAGNVTTSGDFVVTTSAAAAFSSDDFSGDVLDTSRWTFVNPARDGTLALDGTRALLSVPAGRDHDVWAGGNAAPRLMQAASNEDFALVAKFESRPAGRHAMQGIIVEAAPGRYLRFDFLSDGSGIRLFAASFAGDQPTVRIDQQAAAGWGSAAAMYLRVRRAGNQWTLSYSYDGNAWTTAGSFSDNLAVTKVGVFAGNQGGPAAPAFTAAVDYFFDADNPIDPQDNAAPGARDDAYAVVAGETITVDARHGVLMNDTDVERDPLTAVLVAGPTKGTLAFNADGSFTYTAGAAFEGEDTFVYQVSDAAGNTDTAVVVLKDAVLFTKHVADTSMGLAHFVIPADFDGDGDLDLVATSEATHSVAWFENDGSLNFTKHVIESNLNSAYPVSAADLDQDGDVDVLVGGYRADLYVWYENDGSGAFARREIASKDGPHSIIAADVDADGDLDLVTASQDAGTIAWYENDGNENFAEHVVDAGALAAKSALPADMDGDGDVDIVTASFGDDTVAWYENDGAGAFTKHAVSTTADGAYYAVAADIDGDGDQDIVSASQLDNTVAWYRNDGAAGFAKVVVDANARGARAVFAADVNGDGAMDVLAASVDDNTVAWHESNGDGTFTKHVVDTVAGAYGVWAIDFDGDGRVDVLSAGRNDGTIAVHRRVTFVSSPAPSGPSDIAAGTAPSSSPTTTFHTAVDGVLGLTDSEPDDLLDSLPS